MEADEATGTSILEHPEADSIPGSTMKATKQ
jgi:hypothetical protein